MLMKYNLLKTACIIVATFSLPVLAANDVTLNVTGTITPDACTPTISHGGSIDYGTIRAGTLSKTSITELPPKTFTIQLRCNAPTKVGMSVLNGRPDTAAGVDEQGSTTGALSPAGIFSGVPAPVSVVGLGASNSKNIGGYRLRIDEDLMFADSSQVLPLMSEDNGTNWTYNTTGNLYIPGKTVLHTWFDKMSMTPLAASTFSAGIEVQAYINKTSELDLSGPISLDGLTTFQFTYL